jgi:hypothetical protein
VTFGIALSDWEAGPGFRFAPARNLSHKRKEFAARNAIALPETGKAGVL